MYPKITFTITTFSRLNLFMQTMTSFLENCLDKQLIIDWLLVDDGSSEQDLIKMSEAFPFFKIIVDSKKGQAASLNYIIKNVETEWFFHCEDDWLFLKKGNFIKELFEIAFQDERLKNVILSKWTGNPIFIKNKTFFYNLHKYDPVFEPPITEIIPTIIKETNCNWFGYSWNPGLHHIPTLKFLGELDETHSPKSRRWDRDHALKYLEKGFRTANILPEKYIEHLGKGKSKYTF